MKTFLHYTKEQELDEGLFGMLGSATRGLAKAGEIASISKQAFSGLETGAKSGDGLRGATAGAGSIVKGAEESRKSQQSLDNMLMDTEDDLKKTKLRHARAKTPEEKDYYQEKIKEIEERLKTLAKVEKPSDLEGISRAASSSGAAKIRARYP